jgi:hypothetical protein
VPLTPPLLQFLKLPGYQTQPVPGSTLLYTIDTNRPIGYVQPTKLITPTLTNPGVWRAARRDTSVVVDQLIGLDMGIYRVLGDAQTACQDDADLNDLDWTLVWLNNASYETRPVVAYEWLYDISQPSPDSSGIVYYRAAKRNATLPDAFANAIPLGNYTNLPDAQTACQNDFAVTFPPS